MAVYAIIFSISLLIYGVHATHPSGKSTTAVLLAQVLAGEGQRVGLLDVDICGPSSPFLLGVEDQPVLDSQWGWQPVV